MYKKPKMYFAAFQNASVQQAGARFENKLSYPCYPSRLRAHLSFLVLDMNYSSVPTSSFPEGFQESLPQTFDVHPVEELHEKTSEGVRFNVQKVTPALGPLRQLKNYEISKNVCLIAKDFYENTSEWKGNHEDMQESCSEGSDSFDFGMRNNHFCPPTLSNKKIKIEQHSVPNIPEGTHLVEGESSSTLMQIVLLAFAKHYPLVLSPEHIWLAILAGVSVHINSEDNAEKLRSKFVQFEGKENLIVRADHLIMGAVPPHIWEQDMFGKFSSKIRTYIGDEAHNLFCHKFSATTKAQEAAMDITLMCAMKKYFDYQLFTKCGIPWIELTGTRQDWVEVRKRANDLYKYILPELSSRWLPNLLPVLDEFVEAYDGKVNHAFWQRMCKHVPKGERSGDSDKISGWINNFYPYLRNGDLNHFLQPWEKMKMKVGPSPKEFPTLVSSVPFSWDYYGSQYPLHLHAGFLGITQSSQTLAIAPYIGWIISHDPQ